MLSRNWLAGLLLLLRAFAWSQTQAANPGVKHSFDVYGGYSYLPTNVFQGSGKVFGGESGWDAGLEGKVSRWLGIKGEFSQYFSTYDSADSSRTEVFLVGPEASIVLGQTGRWRSFADLLVGGTHVGYSAPFGFTPFKASTVFALSADGGVDYRLSRRLWLRGQGGYLYDNFTTNDNQLQSAVPAGHVRIATGLVYEF